MPSIKINDRYANKLSKSIMQCNVNTSLRAGQIFKLFAASINMVQKMPDVFTH